MFWFSLQLLSETFLILRRTERDMIKNVYRSSCNVLVIVWQILMEIEFSRQTFKKQSNMKLHENPSSGSRIFPCWTDVRSDGHNETGQSLFFPPFLETRLKKTPQVSQWKFFSEVRRTANISPVTLLSSCSLASPKGRVELHLLSDQLLIETKVCAIGLLWAWEERELDTFQNQSVHWKRNWLKLCSYTCCWHS